MQRFWRLAGANIVKESLLALLALALVAFAVVHLLGNLTIFQGLRVLDGYADFLDSLAYGYAKIVAESLLLATLFGHALLATLRHLDNLRARPIAYACTRSAARMAASQKRPAHLQHVLSVWASNTFFTRLMWASGVYLAIFLVIHVGQFRLGWWLPTAEHPFTTSGAVSYRLCLVFSNPLWVAFHTLGALCLGLHLAHGTWSACQSLGLTSRRLSRPLEIISLTLATVVALTLASIPTYIHLHYPPNLESASGVRVLEPIPGSRHRGPAPGAHNPDSMPGSREQAPAPGNGDRGPAPGIRGIQPTPGSQDPGPVPNTRYEVNSPGQTLPEQVRTEDGL